jgi:hypothetical protein
MRIVTANRFDSGRVVYVGADQLPVDHITDALVLDESEADPVLAAARARPDIFVNPYLVETVDHTPSGRDRLKESIRAAGPTVGNSLERPA